MTHIALNAHLLSNNPSYRQAGIHQYIQHVLATLPTLDSALKYTILANHELNIPHTTTQVSRVNTSSPSRRILWEQLVQPIALHRLKPDLYHALAFVAPLYTAAPMVVTVYDLSFLRFPEVLTRSRRLYLKTLTRSTCQRAKRIIAISQSTAHDLVELLGVDGSKIDIAYPGVSPAFCPLPADTIAEFRRKKALPEHFFLFVGTLEPRKNLPMLLRAYAQLPAEERQHTHLVLGGGKGWLYEEIFATIERFGLADTVHMPGYIPGEELIYWYNAADAFVYPALYEGFGIPVVEALACGKPVLTSNVSSLPEAGGEVSVLLPPTDESAWTMAFRQTIHNPNPADAPARQAWARTFTWEQTAYQTLNTYRQVLATV